MRYLCEDCGQPMVDGKCVYEMMDTQAGIDHATGEEMQEVTQEQRIGPVYVQCTRLGADCDFTNWRDEHHQPGMSCPNCKPGFLVLAGWAQRDRSALPIREVRRNA